MPARPPTGASELSRAIGAALRRAREQAGYSRRELSQFLPAEIHLKTIAGYERGDIHVSTERFVEICRTMGLAAPAVLAQALEAAEGSPA